MPREVVGEPLPPSGVDAFGRLRTWLTNRVRRFVLGDFTKFTMAPCFEPDETAGGTSCDRGSGCVGESVLASTCCVVVEGGFQGVHKAWCVPSDWHGGDPHGPWDWTPIDVLFGGHSASERLVAIHDQHTGTAFKNRECRGPAWDDGAELGLGTRTGSWSIWSQCGLTFNNPVYRAIFGSRDHPGVNVLRNRALATIVAMGSMDRVYEWHHPEGEGDSWSFNRGLDYWSNIWEGDEEICAVTARPHHSAETMDATYRLREASIRMWLWLYMVMSGSQTSVFPAVQIQIGGRTELVGADGSRDLVVVADESMGDFAGEAFLPSIGQAGVDNIEWRGARGPHSAPPWENIAPVGAAGVDHTCCCLARFLGGYEVKAKRTHWSEIGDLWPDVRNIWSGSVSLDFAIDGDVCNPEIYPCSRG